MNPQGSVILEFFGEGKTDVGAETKPAPPKSGVVPILVHRLCNRPPQMLVKRRGTPFLQGKGLWQKVRFAKRQASCNRSQGAVYVVDSEGGLDDAQRTKAELVKGRDFELPDFAMAVGVAHPCIEAWLLTDGSAIRCALDLAASPILPETPEGLPAPQYDRRHNPKTVLVACTQTARKELSASEKDQIALAMNDLDQVRRRCPQGFAPFAEEVEQRIRPLFQSP